MSPGLLDREATLLTTRGIDVIKVIYARKLRLTPPAAA